MPVDYLDIINKRREESSEQAETKKETAPVLHAVKRKGLTRSRSRASISNGTQPRSRRTRRVKRNATRSDISTDEALEMARKKKSKAKSSAKSRRRRSKAAATVAVKETRKRRRGRAKAKTAAKTRRKRSRARAKASTSVARVRRRKSRAKAAVAKTKHRRKSRAKAAVAKTKHRRRKSHAKAVAKTKHRRKSRAKAAVAKTKHRRRKSHAKAAAPVAKTRRRKKSHAYAGKRKHGRAKARRHSTWGNVRRHKRRVKERYALENPLSGTELAVGALTLALGFGVADVTDRYLATHALEKGRLNTDNVAQTGGPEHLVDNGAKDGAYKGLTNGSAVLAPMDMKRWLVGGVLTAVPLGLAHFVKSDVGRSALQFFGFGVGARILGKALVDGVAYLTRKSAFGQRLYNYENVSRAVEKKDTDAMAYLPYYGATADGLTGRGLTYRADGTLGALPMGLGGCRPLRYTTQEVVSTPPPPAVAPPPPPAAVAPFAPPAPAAPPVALMPPRMVSPLAPSTPAFSPAPPPPPALVPSGSASTEGGGVPVRSTSGSASTDGSATPARPSGSASTEGGGTPMMPSSSPPEPREPISRTPPRTVPTRESPEGTVSMGVMLPGASIPVAPPSPEGTVMLEASGARGARGMFAPTGAGKPMKKNPFLWGHQGEE